MRDTGAVYVKAGSVEITLGPEPVREAPRPQFVHDEGEPPTGPASRKNPLLGHPALKR